MKFRIWELEMKSRGDYYPFRIDKSYDVFSLYYDDDYINGKTGVFDDDLNDAKELPNLCFSIFEDFCLRVSRIISISPIMCLKLRLKAFSFVI